MIDVTPAGLSDDAREDLEVLLDSLALRTGELHGRRVLFLADSPKHWLTVERGEGGEIRRVLAATGFAAEAFADAWASVLQSAHAEVNEARGARAQRRRQMTNHDES